MLSEGSINQANSVNGLVESLNKMNKHVQKNSINANKTNDITKELVENIKDVNCKLDGMLKSISNIEKKTTDINTINDSINDIAEQTDLLALNASIEAARACLLYTSHEYVSGTIKIKPQSALILGR